MFFFSGERISLARRQVGVSMTETLIVLPVVIFFVLAIVQFGLIYRTKITLEYAAHEAARAGSLNNGLPLPFVLRTFNSTIPNLGTVGSAAMEATTNALTRGSVWQGMVNAMMPLYVTESSVTGLAKGWVKTNKDLIESSCIEYLNPTQQTFLDWGFIENFGENRWVFQIPNDTLRYRKPLAYDTEAFQLSVYNQDPLDPNLKTPSVGTRGYRGAISNKTLGETNVLHLRVHYGYKLNIPIVNTAMLELYKLAMEQGMNQLEAHFISEGKIPLQAEGAVGMQSPLHWHPFYSFGPTGNRTPALPWSDQWNVGGDNALEAPRDVFTKISGFITNGARSLPQSALAVGVDAAGKAIGSGFAFCPAVWNDGIWQPIESKLPNSAKPGSAN